jgi:hypothetical protein
LTNRASPSSKPHQACGDPDLVPYLYHWCRPIQQAWLKTHGFNLFAKEYVPPPGEPIFTTAQIDHISDAAVAALTRLEDTSTRRTPEEQPLPTQDPSRNAVLIALAHTASHPVKRKRDHATTPPRVSFATTGTTLDDPFPLVDDELALRPVHGTQSSSDDHYDPAKKFVQDRLLLEFLLPRPSLHHTATRKVSSMDALVGCPALRCFASEAKRFVLGGWALLVTTAR